MAQMYHSPPAVWQGFCSPELEKEVNQECIGLHDQVPNPSGDQAEMLMCRCVVVQDSFPHQPEGMDSCFFNRAWMPVKVHITPIRGFVWVQSGIPSPSQKSCLCHLSRYSVQSPFVVCTRTEEPPLLPNLTSTPAQASWVHVIPLPFSRTFESPISRPRSNAESTRYRKQDKLPGCVKVRVTG